MMIMAGAFGADARLVAFMQYLRVVCVAGLASIVARLWIGPTAAVAPHITWFPVVPWADLAATLAIAGAGAMASIALRIPAGALLIPMIAGALLEGSGLVRISLPPWLLAVSYAFLGWSVGLGFTREILGHARRALPQDRCDPRHDRGVWRACRRVRPCSRYRPADGLSRNESEA
jgi:uncharacterized membrane protein AbrB (regulator of aidB expression)